MPMGSAVRSSQRQFHRVKIAVITNNWRETLPERLSISITSCTP
jgi:hypothetical protein